MKKLLIIAILAFTQIAAAHDYCCFDNHDPSKRVTIEGKIWRHYHDSDFYIRARKIRLDKLNAATGQEGINERANSYRNYRQGQSYQSGSDHRR